MRFFDLIQLMHQHYEIKISAGEFVPTLIDAILDDASLEEGREANPLYVLGKSTKEAYYSGRLPMSKKNAAALLPRMDEERFATFVNTCSYDALVNIGEKLAEFGFDVDPYEVGAACANILAQTIRRRAENKSDDITSLDYKRKESGIKLKDIAPATIERRGDKLHICGEVITIHQALIPDTVDSQEMRYIKALCDAYADNLGRDSLEEKDIQSLPRRFSENFKEQRKAYYSALSIERSVRDVFDDGEDEFNQLKEDAWHGIGETYWQDYKDGYTRLIAVLEKVTNTTLNASVLCQMRSLIHNLEKKGICHILVNEGTIDSWVARDEQ